MKFHPKERIELTIRDLGTKGEGIGQYQGITVFVPKALPGETVLVEIQKVKKNYLLGKLEKILKVSEKRNLEPPCPYFPICGGCQIMHLSYDGQLEVKRKRVIDAFERIAGLSLPSIAACHSSINIYGYRNKMQHPTLQTSKTSKAIGLFRQDSHDLIDIESCLIHQPLGNEIYQKVRNITFFSHIEFYDERSKQGELRYLLIRTNAKEKKALVTLVTTKSPTKKLKQIAGEIFAIEEVVGVMHGKNKGVANTVYPEEINLLEGKDSLDQNLMDVSISLSPFSFFQVNTEMAIKLYQMAYALANPTPNDLVMDAYSGIGTFAIYLAKKGCKVIGIESIASAVEDAKKGAKQNDVHVDFFCAKVEDLMQVGEKKIGHIKLTDLKCLFLNPPRKGCDEKVIKWVGYIKPDKVVYTSCDPATLARDAKMLSEYGYQISRVEIFDLFPQTMHVETIALFTQEEKAGL